MAIISRPPHAPRGGDLRGRGRVRAGLAIAREVEAVESGYCTVGGTTERPARGTTRGVTVSAAASRCSSFDRQRLRLAVEALALLEHLAHAVEEEGVQPVHLLVEAVVIRRHLLDLDALADGHC